MKPLRTEINYKSNGVPFLKAHNEYFGHPSKTVRHILRMNEVKKAIAYIEQGFRHLRITYCQLEWDVMIRSYDLPKLKAYLNQL